MGGFATRSSDRTCSSAASITSELAFVFQIIRQPIWMGQCRPSDRPPPADSPLRGVRESVAELRQLSQHRGRDLFLFGRCALRFVLRRDWLAIAARHALYLRLRLGLRPLTITLAIG
jgi:hypothetical protein